MIFTSYTKQSREKIIIDSNKYQIPRDKRREYMRMFRKAQQKPMEIEQGLSFDFSDKKDFYVLTVFHNGKKILASYGVRTEAGREILQSVIRDDIADMKNESTPFVVDVLDFPNYAQYFLDTGVRTAGLTGTFTTIGGLIALERPLS